jgi:hypothetical protein
VQGISHESFAGTDLIQTAIGGGAMVIGWGAGLFTIALLLPALNRLHP